MVTEATQPNGQKTAYSYDASGNLLKQTDAKKQVTTYTYDAAGNLLTKTVSGTVTEHYTYRPDGLVATRKDANGNVFTYEYNAFGELTRETAKNAKTGQTTAISYTYDKMGRLVSMSDSTGKTEYSYDALDRITKKKTPNLDAVTWTYDLTDGVVAGYHKEVETSAGTAVETTYDRENRIVRTATTKDGQTSSATIAYNADGSRKSVTYSDGTREEYTYFDTNAVKQVSNYAANGSLLSRFTYTYDANGNQTSVTKSGKEVDAGTTTYTYDSLGQLTKVTEPNGVTTSYSYDSVGNRTSETVSVPADVFTTGGKYAEWRTACQGAATEENYVFTTTYYYDNRNRLYWEGTRFAKTNELISDLSYQNDANGNLLREEKRSFGSATDGKDTEVKQEKVGGIDLGPEAVHEYDAYNQVIRSETPQYIVVNTYNGEGLRVGKRVSEKRLVAILPEMPAEEEKEGKQAGTSITGSTGSNGGVAATEIKYQLEIVSGGETFFLYDGENVIIEKANGRVSRNIYAGPLLLRLDGSSKAYEYLYNAHGDVVALVRDGQTAATYDYDAFGNVTRETGTASNAIRYAGYRYDVETGLYYLNARMYNPHTGRFLQADTYAGHLSDPLSLNLYTYCLNNPTRYVDPSGHFGVVATFLIGAAITGLISGTINAGMEAFSEHFLEKRDKLSFRELGLEFAEGFVVGAISGGIGAVGSVGANATVAAARFGTDAAKSAFVKFCTTTVTKKAARSIAKRVVLAGIGGAAESAFMDTGHRLIKGEQVTAQSVLWSAFSGAAFNQVGEFAPDVMKKVGKARNAKKARKLLGDKLPFEDFLSANAKPYELLEKYNIPTTLSLEERKLLDELDVKMKLDSDVGAGVFNGSGKGIRQDTSNIPKSKTSLWGKEKYVTEKGINTVKQHLSGDLADEYNDAMITRIEQAYNKKLKISGADLDFYAHELYETNMMNKGMSYENAHELAKMYYNAIEFNLYHPEVIKQNPKLFNHAWFDFWNIERD